MQAKTMKKMLKAAALLATFVLYLTVWNVEAGKRPSTRIEMEGIAGGKAVLEFASASLHTMTPTTFRLTLTNKTGMPIEGAKVDCDLIMPAMAMPENRPAVQETAAGVYLGEAVFTMAGAWQAVFSVEPSSGGKEILLFDIKRVLLK